MIGDNNMEWFMSLPQWLRIVMGFGSYFLVSIAITLFMSAWNEAVDSSREMFDEELIMLSFIIWPLVIALYPIYLVIKKKWFPRYVWNPVVVALAQLIKNIRTGKYGRKRMTEKEFKVKNDWKD